MLGSLLLGLYEYTYAREPRQLFKEFQDVKPLIDAVLSHMFPAQTILPSAKETNLIDFVHATISHLSYDKEIKAFVIEGAREFRNREKKDFLSLNSLEKEQALRRYEKSSYGSAWLSRIMILGMEGMLSDPIYGANRKETGWKALHTKGGSPRPKGRYLEDI